MLGVALAVFVGVDLVLTLDATSADDMETPFVFNVLDHTHPEGFLREAPVKDAREVTTLSVVEVPSKDEPPLVCPLVYLGGVFCEDGATNACVAEGLKLLQSVQLDLVERTPVGGRSSGSTPIHIQWG